MDIGTAKPSPEERKLVAHHLFDLMNPDQDYSLAQYLEQAKIIIEDLQNKGKLPFVVGGSGQYIRALLEGWEIPRIIPDPAYRQTLEKIAAEKGTDTLYQELLQVDPAAAKKIDGRNIRRVIRALEVSHQAQMPFSQLQLKKDPGYRSCIIGLTAERSELYRRTDTRAEKMIQEGLVDETRRLLDMGYSFSLPSMNSIGYKQIGMFLHNEIDLEEALRLIKIDNHRFIRHQYAWFKLTDERIHWFDIQSDYSPEVTALVSTFLNNI
jgi:tRNA dimethylallyltransferase